MSKKRKDERSAGRQKKTRKIDKIFIRVFLGVFSCAVGIGIFGQAKAYEQTKKERLTVATQIHAEQERKLEFENQKEYYNSDSYIEQMAREKLGMVKPNEVLYINRGQ